MKRLVFIVLHVLILLTGCEGKDYPTQVISHRLVKDYGDDMSII